MMKRIIPAAIAAALIVLVFCLLPNHNQAGKHPKTLKELDGCKVGIQTGLNYEDYLAAACPGAKPVFFSEFSSMLPALQQGKVDALLIESTSFMLAKSIHKGLKAMEKPLNHVQCGIGVSTDGIGQSLMGQLNEFIASYKSDGTYDEMMNTWFENYDRGNVSVDKSGITGENGIVSFTSEAGYEPVCFIGTDGELQGFDIDFIYRFCRRYGYEPQITPLAYEAMAAALASGRCAVGMGLIEDEERAEAVDFTDSYITYDILAIYYQDPEDGIPFFDKVKQSFVKTFIRDNRWELFLEGSATTLLISVLSVLFGTVLGLLLYLWVANGKRAEHAVTAIIGWLAGSTPTVVLLMILYYVIFKNYAVSNVAVAIVGFTIVFGCSFYEKILSGVKAVGTGQEEAARAQGFTASQTFFRIIFPQAAVHFAPNYQSDVISLIQDTSVVGYIAVMDLTKMSDLIRGRTYEAFFPLIATAVIYYLLILIVTALLRKIFNIANKRNRKPRWIVKNASHIE
jgi:polar amino acid transport system substrate-binding protein